MAERDHWRLAMLAREAVSNVLVPVGRLFPLLLLAVMFGAAQVAVGVYSAHRLDAQLEDLADQGRGTYTFMGQEANTSTTIGRDSCESLANLPFVAAAGLVEPGGARHFYQLGPHVPLALTSPSLVPGLATTDAVIGSALAREAGFSRAGQRLIIANPNGAAVTAQVANRRPEGSGLNYAVLAHLPPNIDRGTACVATLQPLVDARQATPLLEATLTGYSGAPAATSAYRESVDVVGLYLARPERFVPILLGALGALAYAIMLRARAAELATYRLSGTSPRSLAALLTLEVLVLAGAMAAASGLAGLALAWVADGAGTRVIAGLCGTFAWVTLATILTWPILRARPTDMAKDR